MFHFHVQEILQKLVQTDMVTSLDINKFKKDAKAIIIVIAKKLFESGPIVYRSLLGH